MSVPLALATWDEIEQSAPVMAATMRAYSQQVACSLRPGSVVGVELGLRAFAGFLLEAHPDVTTVAAVTRAHIEGYKPWLAARPGQRVARVTVNTRAPAPHAAGFLSPERGRGLGRPARARPDRVRRPPPPGQAAAQGARRPQRGTAAARRPGPSADAHPRRLRGPAPHRAAGQ